MGPPQPVVSTCFRKLPTIRVKHPGEMGNFDVRNKEKAPSVANRKGRGSTSGNTICRESFTGMSDELNVLQAKFDCGEGNEGGLFLEFLQVTTAYLRMKIKGGEDVETLICNGKSFEPEWPDPVGPTSEATKAMLQEEYGTQVNRVEKLRVNLSTAYGIALGQCTNCLRSQLKGQDK